MHTRQVLTVQISSLLRLLLVFLRPRHLAVIVVAPAERHGNGGGGGGQSRSVGLDTDGPTSAGAGRAAQCRQPRRATAWRAPPQQQQQ
jgi:hypothetical protein